MASTTTGAAGLDPISSTTAAEKGGGNEEIWKREILDTRDALDKFYLAVMAIFILFMHFGFAFLEAGSLRYLLFSKKTTAC